MSSVKSPEQAVWLEGIRAFQKGHPREVNPYVAGNNASDTNNSVSWFNGWDDAQVIMQDQPQPTAQSIVTSLDEVKSC